MITKKQDTVVVLGSNSFSGADFIDHLLETTKYTVIGLSRSPEKSAIFLPYKNRPHAHFTFHQMDFNKDMAAIISLLDRVQPTYIVNFAAQSEVAPSWEHPEHWYETNVLSLVHLTHHLAKQTYVKKYVHISSPEVYGTCHGIDETAPVNPSTPYAASKAAADLFLQTLRQQYNFPLVTIRSTNVYGASQQLFKIIPRTVRFIKLGKKVGLHGGGVSKKSYIHIRDISRGELQAMEKGKVGELYHLSPDHAVRVKDVVAMIASKMGKKLADVVDIAPERPGQDMIYEINSQKARKAFGWMPKISLEDGIGGVIDWMDENWKEICTYPLEYIHKA